MPFPTPIEDVHAQTPAAGVTIVQSTATVLVSVDLNKIRVGSLVVATYTVEIHQGVGDGVFTTQLCPVLYPSHKSNWTLDLSPDPSGQSTPIELFGAPAAAGVGIAFSGSIWAEVYTISGPGPYRLAIYGYSNTADATIPAKGAELRVRVY